MRVKHSVNGQNKAMSETYEQEEHFTHEQKLQRGQMDINSPKLNVVLFRMGIAKVTVENWMVLQRSTFDITVDGEPYSALQLFFNSHNGEYLIRVWGKTHSKGKIAKSVAELELLCNNIFVKGPACCPGQIGNGAAESFVSIEYPFPRRISPDCAIAHLPEESDHVPIEICSQCTFDTEGKIEIKEEISDAYESLLRDPLTFTTGVTKDLPEEHSEYDTGSTYPFPEPLEEMKVKCEQVLENQIVGDFTSSPGHVRGWAKLKLKEKEKKTARKYPRNYKTWNPQKNAVCPTCGKVGTYTRIHEHMHQHKMEENPLRCPYSRCGASFETKEATKLHIKNDHLRRNKFFCEICGMMCPDKGRLRDHVMTVHEKKSLDIKCTECDQIFVSRQAMQKHRVIVHCPDRFRCQECKKSFSTPSQLKKHLNAHNGVRPFQCDQCGRGLKDKKDLEDHKRTHTGEKPFACQYCSYRGSSKSLLYHHKKQRHKAEFEEERKQKEAAKIRVTTSNDQGGQNKGDSNQDQSSSNT